MNVIILAALSGGRGGYFAPPPPPPPWELNKDGHRHIEKLVGSQLVLNNDISCMLHTSTISSGLLIDDYDDSNLACATEA